MLKKLRFKNYRSFKAWQEIEIKPLTIFVGPNSAGKSSILKLLGLFAQSHLHEGYEYLNLNGPHAKFGSFKSFAHNYSDDPAIVEFSTDATSHYGEKSPQGYAFRWEIGKEWTSLELSESNKEPYRFELRNYLKTYDREFFGGRQFMLDGRRGKAFKNSVDVALTELEPIVSWLEFHSSEDNPIDGIRRQLIDDLRHPMWTNYDGNGLFPTALNSEFGLDLSYMPHSFSSIKDDKFLSIGDKKINRAVKSQTSSKNEKAADELARWEEVLNQLDSSDPIHIEWLTHFGYYLLSQSIMRDKGKQLDANNSDLVELLPRISAHFRSCLKDVHSLGPVRDFRVNTYTRDELQSMLGLEVEFNRGIKKFIDVSLELLGFPFTMQIKELDKPPGQFMIEFQPKNSDILIPLSEMGFGFTQVLPVVFGALRQGITLIEQPELHLHPLSQARLAQLFTTSYMVHTLGEDGLGGRSIMEPRWSFDRTISGRKVIDINFHPINGIKGVNIVETHSEHFIRGLQVRIANGAISPQDVKVYYVFKNRLGYSSVKEMKIKPNGFFEEEWPNGFFDSASNLQEALWEAQK
jgi:hypothetical protein